MCFGVALCISMTSDPIPNTIRQTAVGNVKHFDVNLANYGVVPMSRIIIYS